MQIKNFKGNENSGVLNFVSICTKYYNVICGLFNLLFTSLTKQKNLQVKDFLQDFYVIDKLHKKVQN